METGQTKTAKKRWPDRTQTQRTARRREKLNVIAKQHGFDSWAKLETACLNGAGLAVFIPEAYEVSNGKYYLTTTGNVGLGHFVINDGVYHLETASGVDLGEFTADSLVRAVPIPIYENSNGKFYQTTTGDFGVGEVNPDDLAVIVPIPEVR